MATTSTGLSAGTAAAIITPERPMQLQGYDRGPSTGTLDPLEARAIVFDDGNTQAAIVTADLIGLGVRLRGTGVRLGSSYPGQRRGCQRRA